METATATSTAADNNNAADKINVNININNINTAVSVQPSVSYNTDAQSVQSGVTHGTHGSPHSPVRTAITPLSLSPASHNNSNNNNNSNSDKNAQSIPDTTMGAMEVIPQYYDAHGQQQGDNFLLGGMRQVDWPKQQQKPQQQQQQQHQALNNTYQQNRQRSNPASDDDQTEPSSSANTRENNTTTANNNNHTAWNGYTRSDSNTGATSTFGRLVKSAAKSINNRAPATNTDRKDSADEEGVIEGVLIYGYLQKLNRNGKWQTRWFETDGECLTYFKSSKRVKLLASLDLAKVGSIVINNQDENGCCFTINISKRPYHLRADSKTAMKDWVITLNRVKEARMQEGNVKLVMPKDFQKNRQNNQTPIDLLDDQNFTTPRVVVVANRQRTHAVEDDDFHSWEPIGGLEENSPFKDITSQNSVATTSIARWQKPKTSITNMADKVLRWARSLRKYHCSADAENQVMILNHNLSTEPSTIAATQSVSTTQSPKNVVNTVPTADLLDTGGDKSMNLNLNLNPSVVPSNQNNTGSHQAVVEDDVYDDEDSARFLS